MADDDFRNVRVQPVGFTTGTLHGDERPTGGSPDIDLYLEYPDTGIKDVSGLPATPRKPFGISGGGVWALHATDGLVWTPDLCELIGIEYAWVAWKFLRCTQIQHWLTMVAEDLPDTATAIEPVLAPATSATR